MRPIYMHIHIIGHYNPSVRITISLPTPLMSYVLILYINGGVYNLKPITNDIF